MGQAAVTDAARKDEAALEDYQSGRDFGQVQKEQELNIRQFEEQFNFERLNESRIRLLRL